MSEEIRVLFLGHPDVPEQKIWESEYIVNTLIPSKYTKISGFVSPESDHNFGGELWDILVFNCRKSSFNYILSLVKKIRPKIIIQLSDEFKHENLNHYNSLAKYCNLHLRQYHHKGYTYEKNTIHIPLGYTNGAGMEFMDYIPDSMRFHRKMSDRIYSWAWFGSIYQDRWEMLDKFSNIPGQAYGVNASRDVMIERYMNAKFVPCGRGNSTIDCFRLYEASQCGAIPCVAAPLSEIEETFKYEENPPWIFGHSWHNIVYKVKELIFNPEKLQLQQDKLFRWWHSRIEKISDAIEESLLKDRVSVEKINEEFFIEHYWENDALFDENWFSYPNLYKKVVEDAPENSVFVEVGCWKGRSSSNLAVEIANSKKNITLYCVDTWKDDSVYNKFIQNMLPVEKHYFPLRISSEEASKKFKDKSLDFVFLDAAEEYEDVKKDLNNWMPKIKPGGVLAGHDYYPPGSHDWFPGVKKAVNESVSDIEMDELCFIHNVTKDQKNKFKDFPSVNFISIKETEDRRNLLYEKFKEHGITNVTPHIYDRYNDEEHKIESKLLHRLSMGSRGPVTSHLKAIKEWYYTTDEPYTFMCEDDLGFQTVKYWSFTWKEFFDNLPEDWGCVQLGLLREDFYTFSVGLRNRCWCDWSGVAYLIS